MKCSLYHNPLENIKNPTHLIKELQRMPRILKETLKFRPGSCSYNRTHYWPYARTRILGIILCSTKVFTTPTWKAPRHAPHLEAKPFYQKLFLQKQLIRIRITHHSQFWNLINVFFYKFRLNPQTQIQIQTTRAKLINSNQ